MRFSQLVSVCAVALAAGLWAGCSVDLDARGPGGEFQCATNEDCLDGFECRTDGFCYELKVVNNFAGCIDIDGDGYGVGTAEERQKCPLCEGRQGLCAEDCDDNDKTRNPGAGEACNGRDDNCNGDVDEPTACESSQDCQGLRPYIPANTSVTCESQRCVVKMAFQTCGTDPCPCNDGPIACESSTYAPVPDPSECL